MQPHCVRSSVRLFLLLVLVGPVPTRAQSSEKETSEAGRKAIELGLEFLREDAATWREERKCASCHHGVMTVWALSEARSRGYPVDDAKFRDVANWTRERLANIDKPRDTRPGWNMVNTAAVYLGLMALAVPSQDALSGDELAAIDGHLQRHQEADGSWTWTLAPTKNRPPPVFESDEVLTLLAYVELGPHIPADAAQPSPAREARTRAAAWLARQKPGASTQAHALRLFRDVRAGKAPGELESGIRALLGLQHSDGGWGQEKELVSDGFATGQALYFLSLAGVPPVRPEIRRAIAFLVAHQDEDGSWPITPRSHPGARPMTNPAPIIHIGTAWATLGLLRSLPKR